MAGNSVRKIYITQAMIKEYGTTDGCPKCGEWGASHSAECQRRFEQKLKDAGKAFDIGSSDVGNHGQNSTPVVDVSIPLPRSVGNTVQGSSSGSGSSGPSSDVASNPDLTQATAVVVETSLIAHVDEAFLIAHLAIAEEGPVSELWRDARAYNDGKFPRGARQAGRDKEMANNQDRLTGDYNDFWAGRDYANALDHYKAATLMAHGFNDWNVMPSHTIRIHEKLKEKGVPLQTYLHQGGHRGYVPMKLMNRWFTRYLHGIENDVEKDAKAWVVREDARPQNPTPYADYPNPDAAPVLLELGKGGVTTGSLEIAGIEETFAALSVLTFALRAESSASPSAVATPAGRTYVSTLKRGAM